MGFLKGLFGGNSDADEASGRSSAAELPECGHVTVVPRWANAEDMGKTDRITVYHCDGCNTDFTPAELDAVRAAHSHPA